MTKKTKKGKYNPKRDPRNGSRTGGIARLLSGGYTLPIWIRVRGKSYLAYYIDIVSNNVEYVYYFDPERNQPRKTTLTDRGYIQVLPMDPVSDEQKAKAEELEKLAIEECTPNMSKEPDNA